MESNFIWENLKFFIDTLKSLPVSESLTLSANGSCCVSTNTYFENWIYYPERITSPEKVNKAVHFFGERGKRLCGLCMTEAVRFWTVQE